MNVIFSALSPVCFFSFLRPYYQAWNGFSPLFRPRITFQPSGRYLFVQMPMIIIVCGPCRPSNTSTPCSMVDRGPTRFAMGKNGVEVLGECDLYISSDSLLVPRPCS